MLFDKEIKKNVPLKEVLVTILGRNGAMHGSKSTSDPLTIHNSNVVVGDEVLWYGDINIHKSKDQLCRLSRLFNVTIEVYCESPVRQFCFTEKDKKNKKKAQAEAIACTNPVWSTTKPSKYANMAIEEAFASDYERQQDRILNRRIALGILTPNGTDWTWYNRHYYKYIHAIYRIIKGNADVFIAYPLERIQQGDRTLVSEGDNVVEIETKRTVKEKIKLFIKYFKEEIGYHKEDIKMNKSTWKSLLITRWL